MMRHGVQLTHRAMMGSASRLRNLYLRMLGVRLGGYCWLRTVRVPRQWEDVTLESGVSLDEGVTLLCSGPRRADKLVLRTGVYVNRFTIFDAHQSIEVGPDVMIGPHCFITDGDHGRARGQLVREQQMEVAPVRIGAGAWLGAGVIVLKGVTVGPGAVIGAGSVVTRDVPADGIALGSPARVVRPRI